MLVLGIETSCDETSASVVRDGRVILSNIISSSQDFHKKHGGIIPEIASRKQLEIIDYVVEEALEKAGVKLKNIDLLAVTNGPGLLGSLLVGICFAKGISLALSIPLLGMDHLRSHIYAPFLQPQKSVVPGVFEPFIGLVVSGGHTSLFYARSVDRMELLGATLDDACGEAFDKVAKILGLSYPGGPAIEKMARSGKPSIKFKCSETCKPLDFSFSGIKTAVLYHAQRSSRGVLRPEQRRRLELSETCDICASFQEAAFDVIIAKSLLACKMKKTGRLVIGGGVVSNDRLREKFSAAAKDTGIKLYYPDKALCTDNAAMVAGLGSRLFKKGFVSDLYLTTVLK
jgi:N6-L-threonylcarbamoyladenine synthase